MELLSRGCVLWSVTSSSKSSSDEHKHVDSDKASNLQLGILVVAIVCWSE